MVRRPGNRLHTMSFLYALTASSLVLGAFAQYAHMNLYMDPACSTSHANEAYFPSSSLSTNGITGTCTAVGGTSPPYSFRATDSRIDGYITIDCSGSVLLSIADTTTCVNTGFGSAVKMVSYNTTVPDSGIKASNYVGTDASTDTCAASTGVYYDVLPFDTCLYIGVSHYRKYTSCDSPNATALITSGHSYSDSDCTTVLQNFSTVLDDPTCTVYEPGSAKGNGLWAASSVMTCPSNSAPPTGSPAGCDGCTSANWGSLSNTCMVYSGSCGAFETDSDCWDGGNCYATSSGSCCDINVGAIAGVVIAVIAIIACAIALCCFCCASCPWAKARTNGHCQENQQPQPVVIANNQPLPSMQKAENAPEHQPQTAQPVLQM